MTMGMQIEVFETWSATDLKKKFEAWCRQFGEHRWIKKEIYKQEGFLCFTKHVLVIFHVPMRAREERE